MPSFFKNSRGQKLAYHYSKGVGPTLVFCPGFKSDMEGSKALFLEAECGKRDLPYLRFDYSGHGQSDGVFEEGVISGWVEDAYDVINHVTTGDIILIGSSMGGWVSLLLALRMKPRVKGFIGIAAAPDFTEKGMWQIWDKDMQKTLLEEGRVSLPSDYDEPYIITKELIEDGRAIQLLDGPIDLDIPVKLLQGEKDDAVPSEWPSLISNCLTSKDVEIIFVKEGDHSLSQEKDLIQILQSLLRLHGQVTGDSL